MNAVNPLGPASAGAGDQRSYEPTMEEILASIRRIIADDQGAASARPSIPESAPETVAQPAASLHMLRTDADHGVEAVAPPFEAEPPAAAPDVGASMMVSHGYVAAPQYPMPDPPAAEHHNEGFAGVSAATEESVHVPESRTAAAVEPRYEREEAVPTTQFAGSPAEEQDDSQSYLQLFSAQTKQSVASAFNALAATRLADNSDELLGIAREMMRPMLKAWLDDNLPTMVERLVRAEIERVARGR